VVKDNFFKGFGESAPCPVERGKLRSDMGFVECYLKIEREGNGYEKNLRVCFGVFDNVLESFCRD